MMKRLAFILAVLITSAVGDVSAANPKKKLTLDLVTRRESIVSSGIRAVRWRPGHDQISYIRSKGSGPEAGTTLYIYDVASGKQNVLLNSKEEEENLTLDSYQWSPRGESLLLAGQNDLWLFDVQTRQKRRLSDDPEQEENPTFSPTGERVAFVKGNNLFTLDLRGGLLNKLTTDGTKTILNGKLDWVYEEELAIRFSNRSYEWSPDGRKIAYLRLDDGPVPEYPLTDYLSTHVHLLLQRYPQAGDPNPEPSFHVVAVEGGQAQRWTFPLDRRTAEYAGPWFSWTPDSQAIFLLTLNRAQNKLTVHLWNPRIGDDRVLLMEKDSTWINSLEQPRFLPDGQRFVWLSERDGWLHLYLYGLDGKLQKQLTRGPWMVERRDFTSALTFQVDEKGEWVYFVSTEGDPRERQISRVRLADARHEHLSKQPGTHSLNLSPDGRFFIDTFSDFQTPPETRLLKSDGTPIATIDKPESHLDEYALGTIEFVDVQAADGATLHACMLKPPDFDSRRKYPVIVDVYGGPVVQIVLNKWGLMSLSDHLYAQEGYITWILDGRGSWGRGHAWESAIFKNLGHRELEDQLAGVEYLKSLPYVDPTRIGITGGSYGGYMTLYALTHAPEVFKCGIAAAPVTDWKFYDSIYTERYMRTPQENPEGYKNSSPLEAANQLTAKLLLIHGADDDNVHMQNTMDFINALVTAGRPFELYIQPGQKHGFRGEVVRKFLARRMHDFFRENL